MQIASQNSSEVRNAIVIMIICIKLLFLSFSTRVSGSSVKTYVMVIFSHCNVFIVRHDNADCGTRPSHHTVLSLMEFTLIEILIDNLGDMN